MHPVDLESAIHRELSGLHPPAAPPTLLPRIVAAVHAWATRPWYQRAWFTWPAAGQVAALLLLIGFATGIVLVAGAADTVIADAVSVAFDRTAPRVAHITTAWSVATTVTRALLQPAIAYRAYAFALVVVLGAACATLAGALHRMADGRTRFS